MNIGRLLSVGQALSRNGRGVGPPNEPLIMHVHTQKAAVGPSVLTN